MRFLSLSLVVLAGIVLFFPARDFLGTEWAWGLLATWMVAVLAVQSALLNRRAGAVAAGLAIIADQRRVLAQRRRQLMTADAYGQPVTAKWDKEVAYFIDSVLVDGLKERGHDFARISQKGRASLVAAVERAAIEPDPGLSAFAEVTAATTPVDYEAICAERLRHSGWTARLTGGAGDQGADVIAEKGGRRLVLQCKLYTKPVNNKAVQEASAARQHERAHLAAVVTPAGYTASARSLAATTGVLLLHHDDLMTAFADGEQPASPSTRHRKPTKLAPASPTKTASAIRKSKSAVEAWARDESEPDTPTPDKEKPSGKGSTPRRAGGRKRKGAAADTGTGEGVSAPEPAAAARTEAEPPAAPPPARRKAAAPAEPEPAVAATAEPPAPSRSRVPPEPGAPALTPVGHRLLRRFGTAVVLAVLVASIGGIVHVWIGR